jgi:hypothetical protein
MSIFCVPNFGRAGRRTVAVASATAGLLVMGLLSVATAQAAPSTKYYTATVTPASVDRGVSGQTFTLALTNCGKGTDGCTRASQQTLGSADIQVASAFTNVSATVSTGGWYIIQPVTGGLIELRSDNSTDLAPGQSLDITVTADTPAGVGAYTWTTQVKQSNDFSGAGNDFMLAGSQPQVLVGFPDHLAFVTQPSTVQASTKSAASPMCPAPSVQVVEADGTAVTTGSAQVTLSPDASYGDPGLGGTTSVAANSGLATFGSPDCSTGVTASNLGGGYQLQATATWSYGNYQVTLSTTQDSDAFDVVQVLTTCESGQSCSATANGTHTTVDVTGGSATTTDQLEIAVGIDSLTLDSAGNDSCLGFQPPSGLQVARVLLTGARDKTITLTFDKYLVNQVPNNGTPLFTICFAAPWGGWVTASGLAPASYTDTNGNTEYVGILPDCTASDLDAFNPCVQSRSKHAANEIVTVSVPYDTVTNRADPKLW